jgi:Tol biopolymer transport system component
MNRRSMDPGFDQRIADWLEDDPANAPDAVLTTVLAAFPSIPQRRAMRAPWRLRPMTLSARLLAAAIAIAVVAAGGLLILRPGGPSVSSSPSAPPSGAPSASTTAVVTAAPSATPDWSTLPGRLLVEHFGNPLDLSDPTGNNDGHDLWFLDPADMTSRTAVEFLPGVTSQGKGYADVSSDGRKVVFEDFADANRLYEANLDGTGFHQLDIPCPTVCAFLDPDYDPTGTRIVFVRIQPPSTWLEIFDLATGKTTKLDRTSGPEADAIPSQPAWSPDGKTIAFSRITWAGASGGQPPKSGTLSLLDVTSGQVTELPINPALIPGDPNWSGDSRTIVFAAAPMSQTGGVNVDIIKGNFAIGRDGTGMRQVPGLSSPEYLPGGQYIVFKTGCSETLNALCSGVDNFGVMRADFTDARRVNNSGMDVTDAPQGFSFVAHWVPSP